jgi:hypothetical protein
VRLTKRHYLGLVLLLFLGVTLLTWPMGLFAVGLAQVEIGRVLGIKGYKPPELAQYAYHKDGRYTGEFGDLTTAPFKRGESLTIARSALVKDGFDRAALDIQFMKLDGKVETYRANWTESVCAMSLSVVISSDSNDKIIVSKIGEVGASCL